MLIRPIDAHNKYREYLTCDLENLQKEAWGEVNCPVCKSGEFKLWCQRDFLTYKTCSSCALVYLSPRPTELTIQNYYKKSSSASFFHEHILLPTEATRSSLFEARWDQVKSLLKNQSKMQIIDYGSSIGSFLKSVGPQMSVIGVELNEWALAYANKCKINTVSSIDKVEISSDSSINILTAWEVLAHVTNWDIFNQDLKKVFQKGGYITLTTPNSESIEYQLLGSNHPNVQFPFLQFFSPQSISTWLQTQGFELIDLQTPGKTDLQTIAQELTLQAQSNWPPILKKIFYDESTPWIQFRQLLQDALVKTQLSGHMFVAARKK